MGKSKKINVYTPNPFFNGERNGIPFVDGVASCAKDDAEVLVRDYGYSMDPVDNNEATLEEIEAEKVPGPKDTNDFIRAYMEKNGIPFEAGDTKAVLLEKCNVKGDEV